MQLATVRLILRIGAIGQLLLLASIPERLNQQLAVVAICFIIQLAVIALERQMNYLSWLVIAITAVYGGLGMALGTLFDGMGTNVHHHHADMNHASLLSWQNILMLLFCFGFCWLLYPAHGNRSHKLTSHFCSMTGMIAGMLVVVQLMGQYTYDMVGPQGSMHLVMLFGMVMGVGLIEFIKLAYRRKRTYENFGA